MEGQRRLQRWFRLLLRLRRHRAVIAGVVVLGLAVGRDIVRVRTAGTITTVAILFHVSTMYVRRAQDDLCDSTYGVSVGSGSSFVFDVIRHSHLPATINHLVAQHSFTEDVIVFLNDSVRFVAMDEDCLTPLQLELWIMV